MAVLECSEKPMISISADRYIELLETERWANALKAAGVDNWEGYDFAMGDYYDE